MSGLQAFVAIILTSAIVGNYLVNLAQHTYVVPARHRDNARHNYRHRKRNDHATAITTHADVNFFLKALRILLQK